MLLACTAAAWHTVRSAAAACRAGPRAPVIRIQLSLLCAAMFRIKREFPWFNIMAWLRRDIFVHDEEDRIVAAVTRVWQPFHRTCALLLNAACVSCTSLPHIAHMLLAHFLHVGTLVIVFE